MTGTFAADLPRPRPATTTLFDIPSLSSRRVLVSGARGFIGHHLLPSAMPGALVEPLFMTNPGDLTAVATPRGVDILAGAISSGVEDYLDEERR